jgi:hypothetical protein
MVFLGNAPWLTGPAPILERILTRAREGVRKELSPKPPTQGRKSEDGGAPFQTLPEYGGNFMTGESSPPGLASPPTAGTSVSVRDLIRYRAA